MDNLRDISPNKPLYVYQCPMFLFTVSIVIIVDNGVIIIEEDEYDKFPGGIVRAGQETIQFSAVRYVKEQTEILLKKDVLIPVDFRSEPERSKEGNVIDIGFVCMPENVNPDIIGHKHLNAKWKLIDFEEKCLVKSSILDKKKKFYMDHGILLQRAIDIVMMVR